MYVNRTIRPHSYCSVLNFVYPIQEPTKAVVSTAVGYGIDDKTGHIVPHQHLFAMILKGVWTMILKDFRNGK